jgi:hypothetical protein
LEKRRPWRGGKFVIRIHTNVDGFCINGKGFCEFRCSERELGEGFGFGDPGSVVVRVRLAVVYIFRRDRSDALRLGSHGDGRIGQIIKWDHELPFRGILHHDGGRAFLMMGILISSIEDGDSGCFSFMILSNSLCLLLYAFLIG